MMTDLLRWYSSPREDLARHALGLLPTGSKDFLSPAAAIAHGAECAVGYTSVDGGHAKAPAAFVLPDDAAADMLAWLSVFASDVAPLSQFGRVVALSDWERWQESTSASVGRTSAWACVILGEMLAYNAPEASLESTPVSRHLACWSNATARAALIHGSQMSSRVCTDRLIAIESDSRFIKREIAIVDLAPIWALAAAHDGHVDDADAGDAVRSVLSALAEHERLSEPGRRVMLDDFSELFGESIERRVVAFQQLRSRVQQHEATGSGYSRVWDDALTAAAAYLVGRGTSHFFLLRRFRCSSISAVWFSLMAALQGPRGWDGRWAKLAKAVERQLRQPFGWEEPGQGDVAWLEYAFSTRARSKHDFQDLARLTARTLTIEVLPGAYCQTRFVGEPASQGRAAVPGTPQDGMQQQASRAEMSPGSEMYRKALLQFVELAASMQTLLGDPKNEARPGQGALPFATAKTSGRQKATAKANPRRKRVKDGSTDPASAKPDS